MHYSFSIITYILLIFSLLGCHAAPNVPPAQTKPLPHLFPVYCCINNTWHRVLSYTDEHVVVSEKAYTFEAIWSSTETVEASPTRQKLSWDSLQLPIPFPDIASWAYALTYHSHQKEVQLSDSFYFKKSARAVPTFSDIRYRPYLDYEIEVGIVMHRNRPDLFGYLLVNDLTDRGIQIHRYDAANPGPGFEEAKSFGGALRIGPLIAIGNLDLWYAITGTLSLNNEIRQELITQQCIVNPLIIHHELFSRSTEEWILVSTGTPEGVIFKTPSLLQKIGILLKGRFSITRAKDVWLKSLSFIEEGDTIDLHSNILGNSHARVVSKPE